MSEQPPLPPSYPPEKPPQGDDLIPDWVNESAVRIVEPRNFDNVTPTAEIPVVERSITNGKAQNNNDERTHTTERKGYPITTTLLAGAGIAFAAGLAHSTGGGVEVTAEQLKNELDTSIGYVVLDGANVRYENGTGTPEGNLAGHIKDEVTIATPEGVYVHNDYGNGDWYGLKVEYIEAAADAGQIPKELLESVKHDSDNIVWVNEQSAEVIRGEG